MRIDYPAEEQLPQLRSLWKEAFGDTEDFLDVFFTDIFTADRCRCVTAEGQVAGALYWLDCSAQGRPMAYLYAVATQKSYRGKGVCRSLMGDTHALLRELGYAGCLLVPGEKELFQMYREMGYRLCSQVREFSCKAAEAPLPIRRVSAAEYAALRRRYLPEGGVLQEGENLTFLEKLMNLYAGDGFLFCADTENGQLFCPELLGDAQAAPGIVSALNAVSGTFRSPGEGKDFAMYHPLSDTPAPNYFGLAFD